MNVTMKKTYKVHASPNMDYSKKNKGTERHQR